MAALLGFGWLLIVALTCAVPVAIAGIWWTISKTARHSWAFHLGFPIVLTAGSWLAMWAFLQVPGGDPNFAMWLLPGCLLFACSLITYYLALIARLLNRGFD